VTGLIDCDCGLHDLDDEVTEAVAQAWRDDGSDGEDE
jgi:hypothetical protein